MTAVDHLAVARELERWFRRHARELPWRDPAVRGGYAALVSEAMLQQTQVSRVVDAFVAFMARFPTVEALADADEQEVLAAWTGLGYYRRARHLHAAAKAIVARHGGTVPDDIVALRDLRGVGRYTAGAIASIAFGRREPIVDGNVIRVVLRLHGKAWASDDRAAQELAWCEARALVDASRSPATLNEGLMELGAVVCTPRSPRCGECPVREQCVSRREGLVDAIPKPKTRALRQVVHHHAVIVVRAGRILLERRGDDGLWASMWQVPTIERSTRLRAPALGARFAERGLQVDSLEPVESFVHLTTHREVRFHVLRGRTRQRRGIWGTSTDALERPMSAPMRRIVTLARSGLARATRQPVRATSLPDVVGGSLVASPLTGPA